MKKIRKLLSLVLAMVMVLAMAAPSFAEESEEGSGTVETSGPVAEPDGKTYTITISGAMEDHTYTAYQVFSGDLSYEEIDVEGNENPDYVYTLSNIEWGSDVNGTDLLEDLQGTKFSVLDFSEAKDAADVAKELGEITEKDHADVQMFAKVVSQNLKADAGTASASGRGKVTISVDEAGYYMVKDTTTDMTDQISSLILEVVKDVTISPKVATVPVIDKEIVDEDGEETDKTDYQIGDSIYFELSAELPSGTTFNDFDVYKLEFVDTLSEGLSLNVDESGNPVVTVLKGESEITLSDDDNIEINYYPVDAEGAKVENPEGDSVYSHKLVITFANVKEDPIRATGGETIYIKYSAALNDNAVTGATGNSNKLEVNFSNDPNGSGTGTTTPEEVEVYTYEIQVIKVDGNTKKDDGSYETKLKDAEFKLYRIVEDEGADGEQAEEEIREYAIVKFVDVGQTTAIITGWTTLKDNSSTLKSGADGKLKFIGLTNDTYHVEEVKAPTGYNLVEAQEAEITNGNVVCTVENFAGAILPSTGGIGTSVFYAAGIILMAGAVFFVVARRKRV